MRKGAAWMLAGWAIAAAMGFAAPTLYAVPGAHAAAAEKGAGDKQPVKGVPQMAKFRQVSEVVRDKCMACHSRDYDLPFYAKVPGIKQMIEKDFRDGLRAMDLNLELVDAVPGSGQGADAVKPVGEATIAKMEWVVLNETMPPAKFTAVHWGSRLNAEDRKAILEWVAGTRASHYATGAAPSRANEPLQPLPESLPTDARKVALGERLFNDKRLSSDNTLACSGCHAEDKAGTDNRRFAEGIRKQFGDINAPTTFNAVFNTRQFWNGRAADLQEQAGGPPLNPIEMGSKDWQEIIAKLATDADLTAEYAALYPGGWSAAGITDAIGEYEKTLITPNSRFDKWLKGDDKALTQAELDGYQRFKAYRCSSCHVGKAVGGQSFEYTDLKADYFKDRGNPLGSDSGLKDFTKKPEDLHRFKVPNLRNIELTSPYMHDGTVTTLDDAVRIMGAYLSGMPIPEGDRALIVAFLRTLTGEYKGKPLTGVAVAK